MLSHEWKRWIFKWPSLRFTFYVFVRLQVYKSVCFRSACLCFDINLNRIIHLHFFKLHVLLFQLAYLDNRCALSLSLSSPPPLLSRSLFLSLSSTVFVFTNQHSLFVSLCRIFFFYFPMLYLNWYKLFHNKNNFKAIATDPQGTLFIG